jgi:hypothetical protein
MKELNSKKNIYLIYIALGLAICFFSLIFYVKNNSVFTIFSFFIGIFLLMESFSHLNSIRKFSKIRDNYQVNQIAEFSNEIRKNPGTKSYYERTKTPQKEKNVQDEVLPNEKSNT